MSSVCAEERTRVMNVDSVSVNRDYRRRVVVPLVDKSSLGKISKPRFNPTFRVKGVSVVLHPLEIVSVAKGNLGERVGSLAQACERIIDALDELLMRWD